MSDGGKPATLLLGIIIGVVVIAAANANEGGDRQPDDAAPTSTPAAARSASPDDTVPPADTGIGRQVVLTFDDGPHPMQTPEVLRILREREVKAVFCLVGEQAEKHPELVRQIVDDGHALCNHTFSHDPNLAGSAVGKITQEIVSTADAIEDAAPGAAVPYFRQPATLVTSDVGAVADSLGYQPLDWTVDTRDWTKPGEDAIVRAATQNLQPGAVILLHDGGGDRSGTVAALPRILDTIEANGLIVGLP